MKHENFPIGIHWALDIIKRKGLFDAISCAREFAHMYLYSVFYSHYHRMRGVMIGQNVLFFGEHKIFQGVKGSITIGNRSAVCSRVALSTFGDGVINIGEKVAIGEYTTLSSACQVSIGSYTQIAAHSYIIDSDHGISKDMLIHKQGISSKAVHIGSDVWLGTGVIVLKGVTIGDGCVVGAGSVVTKSLPPYAIAVGNPARVIKYRT